MNRFLRMMSLSTMAAALCVTPMVAAPQDPPKPEQPESREDRELAEKVRQAINDVQVSSPNSRIQVQVKNGIVTLMGEVASKQVSAKCEEAATRIAGAGKVVNQLQVKT